ncbi:carbon-nitrogen hydrolase family protein [Pelagovum pacificum]|uniref:Carbon-nitrogen hydrolase family protein n=1 Tax=Pelagovum pacificum TaxID=2588711 RepID=A0A5C5GG20_9RHOB|nr:carbon-nitrogen hydrolase family protein [Pelagovum pacificum]QQA43982.1 carbon-nitrogen hydrolase family protein [Pelagovum pacificum]TNY32891.1 carbon-nitrogen hydrolase family protein [Pelagovum pacificum]
MKVGALAYRCERLPGWVAHEAKLDRLFAEAGPDLAVLPEYAAMEAALIAGEPDGTPRHWRDRAAERAGDWVEQAKHIAAIHKSWILAGTGPVVTDRGVVNRAWLVSPEGAVGTQDKMILTPYERTEMGMVPGESLTLFDTPLGKLGILVCYDSEFPLLARALVEAGADAILVPSCTDLPQGQTRVRVSCRARAVEGQCLVVQAPLVGQVSGCEPIDSSTGRAAVFTPPDLGLPPDGILAQTETDRQGWALVDVSLSDVTAARRSGQVGNVAHWSEQDHRVTDVRTLRL